MKNKTYIKFFPLVDSLPIRTLNIIFFKTIKINGVISYIIVLNFLNFISFVPPITFSNFSSPQYEVNKIIIGCNTCKVGFGGDPFPKTLLASKFLSRIKCLS